MVEHPYQERGRNEGGGEGRRGGVRETGLQGSFTIFRHLYMGGGGLAPQQGTSARLPRAISSSAEGTAKLC